MGAVGEGQYADSLALTIKELLHGLDIDRTSCHRFFANQFRALMTAAAYVLYQQLRHEARESSLAATQVSTLRERLIKLGAWVERSARRIADAREVRGGPRTAPEKEKTPKPPGLPSETSP